jgi:Uma2 family endonuclease
MSRVDPGVTAMPTAPQTVPASPALREAPVTPAEHRFVIRNIDWATYKKISEALPNRNFHMAFDGENLELMTISSRHDRSGRSLYRMIVVITEEMSLPICSVGSMTCESDAVERAAEPDDSFYIANEPRVRGKDPIKLDTDPPPDLSVEIEITRSSIQRMKIYAKLRVPEYWRCDGESVRFYHLGADGQYVEAERSLSFPFLTAADLSRFVAQRLEQDENSLVRSFREWVRQQLGSRS